MYLKKLNINIFLEDCTIQLEMQPSDIEIKHWPKITESRQLILHAIMCLHFKRDYSLKWHGIFFFSRLLFYLFLAVLGLCCCVGSALVSVWASC